MEQEVTKPSSLARVNIIAAVVASIFGVLVSIATYSFNTAWWAGELTTEIRHLNKQLEKVIEESYTRREAEQLEKHIKDIIDTEREQRIKLEERVNSLETKGRSK